MKRLNLKRGVMAASALAIVAAPLIQAAPAHAATSGYVVAAAGSDTTENLMKLIINHDLNSGGNGAGGGTTLPLQGGSSVTVRPYNIPTSPGAAPGGFTVPGETDGAASDCPADVTWHTGTGVAEGTAPNGSGAGKNYLAAEDGATPPSGHRGCIDIGRSSSGPGGADPAGFEYYAYAMDAVAWATTSIKAPPSLTTAELQGIYKCTYTDWAMLPSHPGTNGQIQRYLPNPASGTRGFFLTDTLQLAIGPTDATHFSEAAVGTPGSTNAAGQSTYCPAVKGDGTNTSFTNVIEENQASTIDPTDIDKAILPYSAGRWVFQSQNSVNPSIDLRNGARMGGTVTAPSSGTPKNNSTVMFSPLDGFYQLNTQEVEDANGLTFPGVVAEGNVKAETALNPQSEAAGLYPGIRFVYNVLDATGNLRGYQAAVSLYGFDNQASPGFVSPMCTGSGFDHGAIQSNGFAPLNTSGGTATYNAAGTACRLL